MGKIRCTNCNTIIESKHRHDWVTCGCSNNTFVDGGSAYLRCGGKDLRFIEVLEEGKLDNPNE